MGGHFVAVETPEAIQDEDGDHAANTAVLAPEDASAPGQISETPALR